MPVYGFVNDTNEVVTPNLANGNTSFMSNFDPAAVPIDGAAQFLSRLRLPWSVSE